MSKNFENLFDPSAYQDSMKSLFSSSLDMKDLMETQRKNIQVFNQAQQQMMEAAEATGKLQMQLISDLIENSSTLLKEAASEDTPEAKFTKQAELSQKAYEKSIKGLKELADLSYNSNKEFSDLLQKRIASALKELQTSLDKT